MNRTFNLILIASWAIVFLAAVFVLAAPVFAFDDFHFGDRAPPSYRSKPKRHHRQAAPAPRVKGWVVREPVPASVPDWNRPPPAGCRPAVMASGVQGLSERGAEEKARDAWTADVRTKYGELWMDLRFADGLVKRCYRSSVGDNVVKSMRDRLQERMGIDEDGADANDAMEYRCDIWAIPCPPQWIGRGGDVKRDAAPYVPPPPGRGPLTSKRKWLLRLQVTQ